MTSIPLSKIITRFLLVLLLVFLIINHYFYWQLNDDLVLITELESSVDKYCEKLNRISSPKITAEKKSTILTLLEQNTTITYENYPSYFYSVYYLGNILSNVLVNQKPEVPISSLIAHEIIPYNGETNRKRKIIAMGYWLNKRLDDNTKWQYILHEMVIAFKPHRGLLAQSRFLFDEELENLTSLQLTQLVSSID